MKALSLSVLLLFVVLPFASAQNLNLELDGAYAHISGDGGLDGFNAGAALWFTPRVTIGIDYDSGWDRSHLGTFELTQLGLIVTKNHLQDFMIGPRIFLPGVIKSRKHIPSLFPFAEAQFGESILNSKLQAPILNVNLSASGTEFTWLLGGGADLRLASHWVGRVKLDLLRTHFADEGQSRVRFVLGVAYTFRKRNYAGRSEPAAVAPAHTDNFAQSTFMGAWKMNKARSTLAPGTPNNNTVVYKPEGMDVKVTIEGTDQAGNPTHSEWTGKFDGKDYPVTGDPSSDSRSYTVKGIHELDFTAKNGTNVTMTGWIVTSDDGNSRTVAASGIDAAGRKFTSTIVYDKEAAQK
jgi:hypothetical protein